LLQKKRKDKLQQQQIQQQQHNATHVATSEKRKEESDNKQTSGFITLDTQQPNCASNHHAQFPLQALQNVP
jgi:hypothetical protein